MGIERTLGEMEAHLEANDKRIDDLEITVKSINNTVQRGIGAMIFSNAVTALIIAALVLIFRK